MGMQQTIISRELSSRLTYSHSNSISEAKKHKHCKHWGAELQRLTTDIRPHSQGAKGQRGDTLVFPFSDDDDFSDVSDHNGDGKRRGRRDTRSGHAPWDQR